MNTRGVPSFVKRVVLEDDLHHSYVELDDRSYIGHVARMSVTVKRDGPRMLHLDIELPPGVVIAHDRNDDPYQ